MANWPFFINKFDFEFFRAVRPPRLSIHSSVQILLPRYLMNGLSNLDETYIEYLLAPTDDLINF